MKILKKVLVFTTVLSTLFSLNAFAMKNNNIPDRQLPTPQNENYEDESLNNKWTWLNDELCIRFRESPDISRSYLENRWNLGTLSPVWAEKRDGIYQRKIRDTYAGKWSQSPEGIWSFEFDDKTIPVGVTKIDGVLYAFTGYGELKEGYEYYDGLKTAADGLVTADNAEFKEWLATQYLPECTSHE
ncbi:hypothetical protein AALB39_26040 [Lachnospiraceae bacterium 54-53]